MQVEYELSDRAINDLDAIWAVIAADSIDAANRVEEAIFDSIERIAQFPKMGSQWRSLTQRPLRFLPVPRYPNYVIAYRLDTRPIRVAAVIHGARNLRKILRDPKLQ